MISKENSNEAQNFYHCPNCKILDDIPRITIDDENNYLSLKCSKGHEYKIKEDNVDEIYNKMTVYNPNKIECENCKSLPTNLNPLYINILTKLILCKSCRENDDGKFILFENLHKNCLNHDLPFIGYCETHKEHFCRECKIDKHSKCDFKLFIYNSPKDENIKEYYDIINERKNIILEKDKKVNDLLNKIRMDFLKFKNSFLSRLLLEESIIKTYNKLRTNISAVKNCLEILEIKNKWNYKFDCNLSELEILLNSNNYNNDRKKKQLPINENGSKNKNEAQGDFEEDIGALKINEAQGEIEKELENENSKKADEPKKNKIKKPRVTWQILSHNQSICSSKTVKYPEKLKYKYDITSKTIKNGYDNYFACFNSFRGESLVVYSVYSGKFCTDLECFSLEKGGVIEQIINAHRNNIFCCRHAPDKNKSKDYIITSSRDNDIKVWNVTDDWDNIIHIEGVYNFANIFSIALLVHENLKENYVISSNNGDKMKVFDFKGKFLFDLGIREYTIFIDIFYDKNKSKYFIINANSKNIKAYDFDEKNLFKSYEDKSEKEHYSAAVTPISGIYYLIESDGRGNIRVWNFYSGMLEKKYRYGSSANNLSGIGGITVWDEHKLFICDFGNKKVKLININGGNVLNQYDIFKCGIASVKKINHPKYGDSILTLDDEGTIKLFG